MPNNELVALYEATRSRARSMRTWRVRWAARGARRALRRHPGDQACQVRLVALEQELRARGLTIAPTFPTRPNGPRRRRRRWWR